MSEYYLTFSGRWQPLTHPADPRYIDNYELTRPQFGLHAQNEATTERSNTMVTIETLKKKWGFLEMSEKEKTEID